MTYRRALRAQLHIKALAYLCKGLLLIIFALYVARYFSMRSTLAIDQVQVAGVHVADTPTIEAIAREELAKSYLFGFVKRGNQWLYPKEEIAARIKETNGWIDTANVVASRKKIDITIEEHTPAFLWCGGVEQATTSATESYCYFANKEGYIFAPAPGYSGFPYLRIVSDLGEGVDHPYGAYALSKEEFERVNAFALALREAGYAPLAVEDMTERDYRFHTNLPWYVVWNSGTDIDLSIAHLKAAIDAIMKEMRKDPSRAYREIDLRFGDKVFYR